MRPLTSYPLATHTEVNLLPVLMMCELFICSTIKKCSMKYEAAHKLSIKSNTEVNLLAVLMMYEWLIHNIIKGNELQDMKLFTSYLLTTNTDVNLPPVLMMCELFI